MSTLLLNDIFKNKQMYYYKRLKYTKKGIFIIYETII